MPDPALNLSALYELINVGKDEPDVMYMPLLNLRSMIEKVPGSIRQDIRKFLLLSQDSNENAMVMITRDSIGFCDAGNDPEAINA